MAKTTSLISTALSVLVLVASSRVAADITLLEHNWSYSAGGEFRDEGRGVAIDSAGAVVTIGETQDGVKTDLFVTKLNADGSEAWTQTIGGSSSTFGNAVTLAGDGGILVTGRFLGTVDFDASSGMDERSAHEGNDIFVTRLNADGSYGWTYTAGDDSFDWANDVAVDASGNVYITGYISYTVDFDPTAGVDEGSGPGAFVTRLNADGSYGWTRTTEGAFAEGMGIEIDPDGDVSVTGFFHDTVDFDPTSGTDERTSLGDEDVFVTRWNADGSYQWTRTFGGTDQDIGRDLVVDDAGNAYVVGLFNDPADFDPTDGLDDLTVPGRTFVTRFNDDGSFGWTHTSEALDGFGIALGANDSLLFTGYFEDTRDFDLGGTGDLFTANGERDLFVSSLGLDGSYQGALAIGGTQSEISWDIATNENGGVAITGFYTGTVDMDFTFGEDFHTAVGQRDIFAISLTTIPAPGAALLAMIGLSMVGWAKRRFA